MEDQIQVFNNEQFGVVRTVLQDGEPWFVAADVCKALEIGNPTDVMRRLDADERTLVSIEGASNGLPVNAVNEPGLYTLVLTSRKPEAKAFKRWITHEVIPSIRKHGGYLTPQKVEEVLLNPDTIIQLATQLKEERARTAALTTQITVDAPYTEFGKSIASSNDSILLGDFAKVANNDGIKIGRNRLFRWLRDKKYLQPDNKPYQRFVDQGLFELKESNVITYRGDMIVTTTLLTGKGQLVLMDKLRKEMVA